MKLTAIVKLLIFVLLILPSFSKAENLVLLSIPLTDDQIFTYEVDQTVKCSFRNVTQILTPQLNIDKDEASLTDKVNFIQRKINLDVEESDISNERISFTIAGAENMTFEFFFNKKNDCRLVRVLKYNKKRFNMKAIKIDYKNILNSSVLEKVTIESTDKAVEDLYLYPWVLFPTTPTPLLFHISDTSLCNHHLV